MFALKKRVSFYETDGMQVVHHANYLHWFEEARVEYLRAGGMMLTELMSEGIVFPIVEVQCRYLAPARYDDQLTVKTWLRKIDRVQLQFEYEVVRDNDGEVLTRAMTRGTYTRIGDGKIVRMPKEQLEGLEKISREDRNG